ncbi:MAG: zinc ribbon domain-containing protein [Anaerolineae bacterium]|nr:zinc ribbon domain-containing protein [Anaerolineae bacterium]
MNRTLKWSRALLVNGILVAGLVAMLIAYLVVVADLPTRVYTEAQMDFLAYNEGRIVTQGAPTWNLVLEDDETAAAILPVQQSLVRATLDARFEEQDNVSVTVYDLGFRGQYRLTYPGPSPTATVGLFFPFPNNLETLHEVQFLVDGAEPLGVNYSTGGIHWQTVLEAGEERQIEISYRANGADSFTYALSQNQRSDVDVVIAVQGLTGSEVPRFSLPATDSSAEGGGETFAWQYAGLIASRNIHLTLPARLSFAQRVAQLQDDFFTLASLAPFLVALFLVCLAGMLRLGNLRLRLEGYLLAGCGLAFFYPLLTFLSGLVDVVLAAVVALVAVSALQLLFFGLTLGWRKTWWRAGLLLLVFLGFFSLGTLLPWSGLLVTCGGLLLIGAFMLLYARRPAGPEPAPPALPVASPAPPPPPVASPVPSPKPPEPPPAAPARHCPHCGRGLADDHRFCPCCGHDVCSFIRCPNCSHDQFVPPELAPAHCVRCGKLLRGENE